MTGIQSVTFVIFNLIAGHSQARGRPFVSRWAVVGSSGAKMGSSLTFIEPFSHLRTPQRLCQDLRASWREGPK